MRSERPTGLDLVDLAEAERAGTERLAAGALVLRRFASDHEADLVREIRGVASTAPFRRMLTPGGHQMSVAMTNCGNVGWVTDLRGYRYDSVDPDSQRPWPPMPEAIRALAVEAAQAGGYRGFEPDACLVNRYEPGTRLSLHQDRNERNLNAPVVSISLGLPAIFLFGGSERAQRPQRVRLVSGDVVVWGGPSRLAFHGVAPLEDGVHPATGACRINLTIRCAL
ncbi:MAG TPA: DNA oxidative demethylase AlkB [Steroidobacteraceae bacterium]|nr:DNA oxidative demethylase AlkB [Steroidobacteraceae bacterium]